jgi:hypothetical protein
MIDKESVNSVAHYFKHPSDPHTITVSPADRYLLQDNGYTFDHLHDGVYEWFVTDAGFSPDSFVIIVGNGTQLVADVTFVNDGIVMAKLHGYID